MLLILKWRDCEDNVRELSIDMSVLGYIYIGRLDRDLRERFYIDDISNVYIFNIDKEFIQDMNVESRKISRKHVLIKLISGKLVVKDHGKDGSGSTYGTYVDGVKLRKGSSIVIHGSRFMLRIADLDIEVNIAGTCDSSLKIQDSDNVLDIIDRIVSIINDIKVQFKCGVPVHLLGPHVVALEDLVRFLDVYLSRVIDRKLIDHIFTEIYNCLNNVKNCLTSLEDYSNDPVLLSLLDRSLIELKGHVEALEKILRRKCVV